MKKNVLNGNGKADAAALGRGARMTGAGLLARHRLLTRLILGAAIAACAGSAWAEEEKAEAKTEAEAEAEEPKEELTPEQMFEGGEETFENWVEVSYGAMLTSGSKGAAQERMHLRDGMFGGIEDLHYQKQVNKETLFSMDARALAHSEDYRLGLSLVRENLGFVRFHFEQYRTWYNARGGYFPQADLWLPAGDDTLGLDRGEVGFAAGLTLKNAPRITIEYLHQYRNGTKDSTVWGPVSLGFHTPDFAGTRGMAYSFYDIDEERDTFKLDVEHRIKKTDFGVGMRYDTGSIDNSRKMTFRPAEPTERKLTNREESRNNTFSAHAWTETWLKENLVFSSGFLFANLDDNFSGSRIYGDDFDVNYSPNALNGAGYVDLDGVLHKKEYVMNLNLMSTPVKHLAIVPSIRVQKETWDAESFASPTTGNNPPGAAVRSASDGDALDVQERLDIRYSGVTNWVFYARGEWMQGEGRFDESGGLGQTILRDTDTERFFQKYSAGARWYPTRVATFDVGGYYKRNAYDYDHTVDSTDNSDVSANRYPAYLVMQNLETLDGNFRVTLRPFKRVTAVTRYEYQLSTITTQPDSASNLNEVESSEMKSHIFAQNLSWVPWSRLSLQAGFNYVISSTETPGADLNITRAALSAQNNYWTLNLNSTLVLDNKTDLSLGYFYYDADNFRRRQLDGFPLGAESSEYGVTALLSRRLTPNLRWKLRYTYFHSADFATGRHDDFDAHVLFTSLQYRF